MRSWRPRGCKGLVFATLITRHPEASATILQVWARRIKRAHCAERHHDPSARIPSTRDPGWHAPGLGPSRAPRARPARPAAATQPAAWREACDWRAPGRRCPRTCSRRAPRVRGPRDGRGGAGRPYRWVVRNARPVGGGWGRRGRGPGAAEARAVASRLSRRAPARRRGGARYGGEAAPDAGPAAARPCARPSQARPRARRTPRGARPDLAGARASRAVGSPASQARAAGGDPPGAGTRGPPPSRGPSGPAG
jgi:hypothetical protein